MEPERRERPPRGRIDAVTSAIAEERGYRVIGWTMSADNHLAGTAEAMATRVLQHIFPGMIALRRDGTTPSRARNVRAAELIIRGLLQRRYHVATAPELLARPRRLPWEQTRERTGRPGIEAIL